MVNLNDETHQRFPHRSLPIETAQFHPEASPGPFEAAALRTVTRAGPRLALIVALLCVLWPLGTQAQGGLRVLDVEALGMHADRSQVRVGEMFHLVVHVRVRENLSALDELVVPDVATMQLLGDERRITHGAGGTEVVETLTLEPTAGGRYTFAPAYLDAIDPHALRPKRFSADRASTVVVTDPAPAAGGDGWELGRSIATLVVVFVVIAAVALALLGRIRARRERSLVADVTLCLSKGPAAPPRPSLSTPRVRGERVAEALRAYRRSPGSTMLERLRAALFGAAGAAPGATLRDALRIGDPALHDALRAAEGAAFGPTEAREIASRELIDAAEAWLRR